MITYRSWKNLLGRHSYEYAYGLDVVLDDETLERENYHQTLHQMFLMINLGERAGSGLPKIRQAWEPEGGTLHLFDSFEPYDQTRLVITLGVKMSVTEKTPGKTLEKTSVTGKMTGKMTGKTSGKILEAIRQNSVITIPELATHIGVTERSIERNIQKLQANNLLRRIGHAKGGHWEVID